MKAPTIRARSIARHLGRLQAVVLGTVAAGAVYALPPALGGPPPALQDIHDIRPPFHISQAWLWLLGIGAWLLLAALAAAVWSWRRRKALARRMSAHEVALARLREAQALMVPEQAREFSIAVSGIVRTYIEERFEIRAAHHTTPEFLHDCSTGADGLLAPHREILEVFLRHCDLAKFARWVLAVREMEDILASAVDFVIETAESVPTAAVARSPDSLGDGKRPLSLKASTS